MAERSKLLDMLTDYAAAHQHPANIAIHLFGIPSIMLGVLIALSWLNFDLGPVPLNAAWLLVAAFAVFYLTLDVIFAVVFLFAASLMTLGAMQIAELRPGIAASIAALLFVGGYAAQFVGHAIEKSPPVLLKHPVQAQLAAPFFTIVELFQLLGLRDGLFKEIRARLRARVEQPTGRR